jgi:DeoR family ulaG and ulaABCDEF operon transcriptional repressor
VVLADSTKFESRGSMVLCQLSQIHTLITDEDAPPAMLDMMRARGVNVIIARVGVEASSRSAA